MTLREQLARDEGLRLKPYRDDTGHLTIGIGRNLDAEGISMAEADFMLDNDITAVTADVYSHLDWAYTLSEARRGVLLNMAFNLGIAGLLGFRHFLAAMKVGDWDTASKEMLDSHWAVQVGDRAHRLSHQVLTDTIL